MTLRKHESVFRIVTCPRMKPIMRMGGVIFAAFDGDGSQSNRGLTPFTAYSPILTH